MYRALRADKLRLVALEATLKSHSRSDSVPTLAMIAAPIDEIGARAEAFVKRLSSVPASTLSLDLIEEQSAVGGGAAPMSPLPTMLIAIRHASLSAEEVATRLRHGAPPVIARIVDDQVTFDLRTVTTAEESELENALAGLPDQAV
jgi:L-seryl-tRNA(Ser) seleniumtransferase